MIEFGKVLDWDYATPELRDKLGIVSDPKAIGHCFVCRKLTEWIDIDYEGYLCSPHCGCVAAEDAYRRGRG